jgi:hypothetical protein
MAGSGGKLGTTCAISPQASPMASRENEILDEWVRAQLESAATRRDLISENELRRQSKEFLGAFVRAASDGALEDPHHSGWTPVKDLISRVAQSRAHLAARHRAFLRNRRLCPTWTGASGTPPAGA